MDDEKLVGRNGNHYLKGTKIFLEGRVKSIAGKFELLGKECIRKESNSKTTEILNLRNVMMKSPKKKDEKERSVLMKRNEKFNLILNDEKFDENIDCGMKTTTNFNENTRRIVQDSDNRGRVDQECDIESVRTNQNGVLAIVLDGPIRRDFKDQLET